MKHIHKSKYCGPLFVDSYTLRENLNKKVIKIQGKDQISQYFQKIILSWERLCVKRPLTEINVYTREI